MNDTPPYRYEPIAVNPESTVAAEFIPEYGVRTQV